MYVKEEFVYGEVFSQGGHCCGPKTAVVSVGYRLSPRL